MPHRLSHRREAWHKAGNSIGGKMRQASAIILASVMLALGIAAAGFFASQTLLNGRAGDNIASAKGLSERIVDSDTAAWDLRFQILGGADDDIAARFAEADTLSARITEILRDKGFEAAEIYTAPLEKSDIIERNREGEVIARGFAVIGRISVATQRPALIEPARAPVLALAREGFQVDETDLRYRFNRLNDIKPDMLREAAQNARIAADEFARNAGVSVGGIRSATQGGFQIDDAPGAPPGSGRKQVRVVTNITFYLEN